MRLKQHQQTCHGKHKIVIRMTWLPCKKSTGLQLAVRPDDIMAAQLVAWDKVLPKFMKDPYFAKVVASQKAWMERVGSFELTNSPDYEGRLRSLL